MQAVMCAVLLCSVVWVTASAADEYHRGWCAGYTAALRATHYNRDQWRTLQGEPPKSHDAVIQGLYARHHKHLSVTESVDRYVVLPLPTEGSVWYFGDPQSPHFHCPSGEVVGPAVPRKE